MDEVINNFVQTDTKETHVLIETPLNNYLEQGIGGFGDLQPRVEETRR